MTNRLIRAIIVDDEPLARKIVREYLQYYSDVTVLAECANAREAFQAISSQHPDVVFLDIQMPEINGFELLDMLDEVPHIIFSTAYDQYAIRAFEINAIDYLLKPYEEVRFRKAVERVRSLIHAQSAPDPQIQNLLKGILQQESCLTRLLIKDTGQIVILPCHEICWIEALDDYVRIHTQDRTYLISQTLTYLETRLDPSRFIRVHRTYIVNLDAVNAIVPTSSRQHEVVLKDKTRLPVSRSGMARLKRFSL